MTFSDLLQCPDCRGRLASASASQLRCCGCDRAVPLVDGIADLVAERLPLPVGADRCRGVTRADGLLAADLPARIKRAAGGRWPAELGDVIELGCGLGAMTEAVLAGETVRSLLVVDTELALLEACRARVSMVDSDIAVSFATLAGDLAPIRDAVADTVIGTAVLAGIGDVRGFLTTVHRMLKTGGRAVLVVPNRRYQQVVCLAMAEALVQRFGRDGSWPEGCLPVLAMLGETRLLLVHRGDRGFLSTLADKHLFDSDALEELASQVGFATAEVIPLDPDPAGGQTITRLCQDAGAPEAFAHEAGPLAATIGRPLLSLLNPQDASAFSVLWVTKAAGPGVRIYAGHPATPAMVVAEPDAAVGGVMPRWSVELLARDTPAGVVVTTGGWCLSNIDALWVRVTLDEVARFAPVWRPRPDVHEVLNRGRVFHPLNALCSGLEGELLFADVHPAQGGCALRVEIILAGGLIVAGPAPERLIMDEWTVISH